MNKVATTGSKILVTFGKIKVGELQQLHVNCVKNRMN